MFTNHGKMNVTFFVFTLTVECGTATLKLTPIIPLT